MPQVTPTGVKEKIRRALERTAAEDADKIMVDVHDGEVTLSGSVRSWLERKDAERAAWAAPGVTEVLNDIKVTPPVYA